MKNEKHGIRFSILDLGKMRCDNNLVVSGSIYATRSCPHRPNQMIDMPIDSILIDVPHYGKILYDLGCDPKGMTEHWPESIKELSPYEQTSSQTLEYQLALLGLTPGDIRTVILSHMHVDHAGYLYLFPHTEVLVQRRELEAAFAYVFSQLDQENHTLYMRRDITVPVDRYTVLERDYEVCPGVTCIALPGHTPGMMGLRVDLDSGTYLFARDAVYTAANYGPPSIPSGIGGDVGQYLKSHEKLRRLEKETGGKVIFGHDWQQWKAMKHAPEYIQ